LAVGLVAGCDDTEAPGESGTGGSASGGVTPEGGIGGVPVAGMAGAGGSDLRPKTFVGRNGTELEDAGRRYVFVGANFWQGMNLATNDASGDPPRMVRELDPPHETAGWYSVYDEDASTIGIIATHARNVATFAQ
jgi:hypothetical protein